MAEIEFSTVLLCEFATQDKTNRHVLGGIYSGDIVVSELPARLPLAIYVEFYSKRGGLHSIEFEILLGKKSYVRAKLEVGDTIMGQPIAVVLPKFEVGIDRAITLTIRAIVDGGRAKAIKSKKIYKGDITASI